MARYQLRRPTPIKVLATRAKRQEAGLGAVGPGSAEEGPESPDSPGSSPSTVGASSPSDSSDSEDDEPPSPVESGTSATSSQALPTLASASASTSSSSTSLLPKSSSQPTTTLSSRTSSPSSSQISSGTSARASSSATTLSSSAAFTLTPTSQGIGAVAPPPQVTSPSSPTSTSTSTTAVTSLRPSSTASPVSPFPPTSRSSQVFSSKVARPTQSTLATISLAPSRLPSATGVPVGENDAPRRTRPEPTLMSKGAEAAAITLSIIGAIALVVSVLFYCKRRRRRRNEKLEAELERDAANYASLRAPESAHTRGSGPHMTQISDRSNTLFGPGSYSRPETVSTRDGSGIPMPQPTPNPFADPPLNKAYDVLAGRPRSTTLTDRGSWIKNPFKDPESERFDPFGELQAKARRERVKQVEIARREAELERQFEAKEKMGLAPPERVMDRKGSGVTLDGLGVLDRSNGGAYR